MLIHDADITGSFLYNGINISNVTGSAASLTALNQFSASINLFTGSYNTGSFTGSFIGNGSGLNGVVSASFATTATSASFASTATSASQATNSNTATSASVSALIDATNSTVDGLRYLTHISSGTTGRALSVSNQKFVVNPATGSMAINKSSISSGYNLDVSGSVLITGSIIATTGFTGSLQGTATNATSASQAANAVTSSYAANADLLDGIDSTRFAVTSSNTFTGTQYVSAANNATSFTSTASIYTDGGFRVTKDAYVSGTIFVNNLTVYGTQSINYITSSQLNIGTNIITVNTDVPAIRFGGLAVYDSGSTRLTGSMLWDSEDNHWVYSNPSGSSYDGGMMISGPRNSSGLGNEQGTLNNVVMKGQGGDHITSSLITETGTATTFYTNALYVSSSNFVGVGTTTPTSGRLQVNSSDTTTAGFFQLNDGTTTLGNSFNTVHRNANDGNGRFSLTRWQVQNASGLDQSAFIGAQAVTGASNYNPNLILGISTGASSYTTRMIIDGTGNLGLGVTPSAWGTDFKAIQLGTSAGSIANDDWNGFTEILNNVYGSARNTYTRIQSLGATRYSQQFGTHAWYSVGAGSGGTTVTFTQAMTLNASGNLVIGNTSVTNSAGYTRIFNVYDTSSAAVGISIASNDYQLGVESDGGFRIRYNGSARLTISNTGAVTFASSVSIGSTLTVTSASVFNGDMFTYQNGGIFFAGGGLYNSGIYGRNNGNDLVFNAGASEKMRITSGGLVGIGTTAPNRALTVASDTSFFTGASGAGAIDPGASELLTTGFNIAGQSSLDISNISVTLNKWKAIVKGGFANNNEGGGLTSAALEIEVDSNSPSITVGNSSITFSRNSSTGKLQVTYNQASNIRVTFVGTIQIINYPQSVLPSVSKIMLGNVGIGATIPSSFAGGGLTLGTTSSGKNLILYSSSNGNNGLVQFIDLNGADALQIGGNAIDTYLYGYGNRPMIFSTNNTERMRITSGGNVLVGKTATNWTVNGLQTEANGTVLGITNSVGGDNNIFLNKIGVSGNVAAFYYSNTGVGSIYITSTTTTYNTSSDYRLKQDLKEFNGLDVVNKIKVYDYEWKANNTRSYGVLAHELQEVLSYAVTGEKDAEIMQGVDYSKLTPILVQAIKELKAELDTLKNK